MCYMEDLQIILQMLRRIYEISLKLLCYAILVWIQMHALSFFTEVVFIRNKIIFYINIRYFSISIFLATRSS